ncbi:right-handed parallel beta-helix repeat-containing protein [Streptomyces sp. AP-93]|uniref:right-handed parallel beta-helix repeat-containing protein n=1 Tax=Streptomyces sp. AP-93 TaxID=2929048 RepID=UPI001FAE848C|nr:right-handed parallel beta-helix repeat-containing protein [Streptomyces sp. AP-93]MCJ0868596.1 right-handed parallel beta-helix repeat-containing protein [Streptomyces sp. AP-93]
MSAPHLRLRFLAVLLACAATAACSPRAAGPADDAPRAPATIRVPTEAPTITAALERARPHDLVLVSPGRYRETVHIRTGQVTLRGTDRNRVVIDGEGRRGNGVVVTAPGVTVENLTVRSHLQNGVLVTGLQNGGEGIGRGSDGYDRLDPAANPPLNGFRVRYVTAANNGLYGIYAFNARRGTIEHNYASGSADSGLYVGQCKPCEILVRGNIAERNAVGYENTNASGPLWVVGNRFTGNRVGMTVGSDYLEALTPQTGATIVGNLIADNAAPDTPEQADGGFGIGLGIAGGRSNTIQRNRITGHPRAGLILSSSEDMPPMDNRATGNVFAANALDAAYLASAHAPGSGNCFDGLLGRTLPEDLADTMDCPGTGRPTPGPQTAVHTPPAPVGLPFLDVPLPPAQPQCPQAATAPAAPATGSPEPVDPATVRLPAATLLAAYSRDGR